MKKFIITYFLGVGFSWVAHTQGLDDIVRYSFQTDVSTARALGVGGSLNSLGADFSTTSGNPAGVALYRGNELMFSPTFSLQTVGAELLNTDVPGELFTDQVKFTLPGFGMVFGSQPRGSSKIETFNFALGFNQLSNFNQQFNYSGLSKGSIMQWYQNLANTFGVDHFDAGMASDAQSMIYYESEDYYGIDYDEAPDELVYKSQEINTSGSVNEFVLSLGANVDEKVMLGATVGIPFVTFNRYKIYTEEDPGEGLDGNIPYFQNLEVRENLTTTGLGINLKLGMIVRFSQAFRFGMAFHSPTILNLEDTYRNTMEYTYLDGDLITGEGTTPDGLFSYSIITPWKAMADFGYIIGKSGFITGQIMYLNYGSARFKFSDFPQDELVANAEVGEFLTEAINIKLGGEIALDNFRFRGGLSYFPSAYSGDVTEILGLHLGLGYRFSNFYLDLGYRNTSNNQRYAPYYIDLPDVPQPLVDKNYQRNLLMFTIGSRF